MAASCATSHGYQSELTKRRLKRANQEYKARRPQYLFYISTNGYVKSTRTNNLLTQIQFHFEARITNNNINILSNVTSSNPTSSPAEHNEINLHHVQRITHPFRHVSHFCTCITLHVDEVGFPVILDTIGEEELTGIQV